MRDGYSKFTPWPDDKITYWNYSGEHATSNAYVTCLFCKKDVKVYVWSFSGCGKKCPYCGAMITVAGCYKK